MNTWDIMIVVLYATIGVVGIAQAICKMSCNWISYWALYVVCGVYIVTNIIYGGM
jgi:hypothetical protein